MIALRCASGLGWRWLADLGGRPERGIVHITQHALRVISVRGGNYGFILWGDDQNIANMIRT